MWHDRQFVNLFLDSSQDTIWEGDEGPLWGPAGARSISISPDGVTALVVSAATGSIAVFRDTTITTRPPRPAPTIAPTSGRGDAPPPSDEHEDKDDQQEWYERLAAFVGIGGVVATVSSWVLLRLLVTNGGGCCCFAVAAVVQRKSRVECPACGKEVEVNPEALDDDARCWCDILRAKAEAEARSNPGAGGGGVFAGGRAAAGASGRRERGREEGAGDETGSELASAFSAVGKAEAVAAGWGQKRKVFFHPDPKHVTTCPHCGIVFCPPCDVRGKKRMFYILFENNPDDSKEEETRAAGPSAMESGTANKVRTGTRSPQRCVGD